MLVSQSVSRKRVVVVGSEGRLGHLLLKSLANHHDVIGLNRKHLNLADPKSIQSALAELRYDFLIIAGALTGVDYCETNETEAFLINAEGPRLIAELSKAKCAHVTYISTDMVFNGNKDSPYTEEDIPDPISVYGASKLKGEEEVLGTNQANLVVRVSWLYGPGKAAFPEWIIGEASRKTDVTLPGNKICCPTYTVDLIESLSALLFSPHKGASAGMFHYCNSHPCNWRDWGQFCLETAKNFEIPLRVDQIAPINLSTVGAFIAKRPLNSAMATQKITEETGIEPRHWKLALHEYLIGSNLFAGHMGVKITT